MAFLVFDALYSKLSDYLIIWSNKILFIYLDVQENEFENYKCHIVAIFKVDKLKE